MNNYELSRDRAQDYFLNFDQQTILTRWGLQYDKDYFYLTFFGKPYTICRKTGAVTYKGEQAGFEETLTIFDLLCHEGREKTISGRFAPVNSLRALPKAQVWKKISTAALPMPSTMNRKLLPMLVWHWGNICSDGGTSAFVSICSGIWM